MMKKTDKMFYGLMALAIASGLFGYVQFRDENIKSSSPKYKIDSCYEHRYPAEEEWEKDLIVTIKIVRIGQQHYGYTYYLSNNFYDKIHKAKFAEVERYFTLTDCPKE